MSPRPSTGGKWPDSFLTVTRKPSAKKVASDYYRARSRQVGEKEESE